jgi:two-component system, NarL family, invasion response regulator UvrY
MASSSSAKPKTEAVRVLIADDHPLIIEGLSAALKRLGLKVVGQVETAGEVIPKYTACQPDVLVLDVRFGPGPTGLDVARDLLALHPAARIVFYSQFDQNEVIREAYRLGGAAFITKNSTPQALARAIGEAHAGKTFFLPEIAERMALLGVRGDQSPRARLDDREVEVFMRLAEGLTHNEIAARMRLSSKTIGAIGQVVKEKLGVQRPTELTLLAVRHGMLDP